MPTIASRLRIIIALLAVLITSAPADAGIISRICHLRYGPHYVTISPQAYYLKRTRNGGSHQDGWLFGVLGEYSRRPPLGFYWAARYFYAAGELDGKTGAGSDLKSDRQEGEFEGRFGFTLGSPCGRWFGTMITLYGGGSYFKGKNAFKSPSPLTCHFRDRVETWNGGVFVSIDPCCWLRLGVDYTVKTMVEAKNSVTNDPMFDDSEAVIGNRVHHVVEVPITIRKLGCCGHFEAGVVPFYRFRHYGQRENFPFDFIATRWRQWGLRATLAYTF